MKIQTQLKDKKDDLKLDGNILSINGEDYDLQNLPSYIDPIDEIEQEQPRLYQKNDDIYGLFYIDFDVQFMFINNNTMLFYDIDMDGDLSIDEVKVLVEHWNMSPEERREAHKAILERKK